MYLNKSTIINESCLLGILFFTYTFVAGVFNLLFNLWFILWIQTSTIQSKRSGPPMPQLTIPGSDIDGISAGSVGRQLNVEVCHNGIDDDIDGTVMRRECLVTIPTGPFSRHDTESPLVTSIPTESEVE